MKQTITFLFLATLMSMVGTNALALEPNAQGIYELRSAQDVVDFATLVNGGQYNANAMMMQDIDMTGADFSVFPIGGGATAARYVGTFDGQHHKFSNLVLENAKARSYGVFNTGSGVVLKDFILDATCSITGSELVGLIGRHDGSGEFTNIGNMAPVTGEGDNVAGLAGAILGAGSGTTVETVLNNCWTTGKVTTKESHSLNTDCGAISGWVNNGRFVFNHCWSMAEVAFPKAQTMYLFRYGGGAAFIYDNCYSLNGQQSNFASLTDVTVDDLPTGAVAYKLNGDQSNIHWYQTLGEDAYPVADATHKQVFMATDCFCDGKPKGDVVYNNTSGGTQDSHNFVDGICTGCGLLDITYKTPNAEGWYEIQTATQLKWFAIRANMGDTEGNGDCFNARLMADIDMASVTDFTPIGNAEAMPYTGTFDGQCHRLSNLTVNASDHAGLFGYVSGGATVKNLLLDATCTINATEGGYAGIIGGSTGSGSVTMSRLGNEGTVTAAGPNAGGIIGVNMGSAAAFLIENCYVTGSITGVNESGAITGWAGGAASTIRNCWATATVEGTDAGKPFYRGNGVAPQNCYDLTGEQVTQMTQEQLESGEMAFMLNGESFLNPKWFQNLGDDPHPVLDATHNIVYKTGDTFADVGNDDSFPAFKSLVISQENDFCNEAIATQSLLDEYLIAINSWNDIATLDEFMATYSQTKTLHDAIAQSVKDYQAYLQAVEDARAQLAEMEEQNSYRNLLENYLDEGNDIEPGDYPNGNSTHILATHTLTGDELKAETEYLEKLILRVKLSNPEAGTEVTFALENCDFKDKLNGWTVETTNGGVTTGGEKSIMVLARGLNTNFSMEQTLEGLPNGVYVMRANAFERTAGDDNSQYHVGQLYLNGNANFVMTINEDIVSKEDAVDGVNCHITGSSLDKEFTFNGIEGYIPKYMVGASYAFNAGRYLNYTAVEVTDRTLTVGARNLGSGLASDWLVVGNIRLFYLGTAEQASEMLDDVLDGYVARGEVIRDFAWVVDSEEVPKYPNMSEALKNELASLIEERATVTTGEEKMELVNKFSVLFNNIYDCRKAYVEMTSTADEVSDAAWILEDKNLIDKNQREEVTALADKAWASYQDGDVTADEARAITEQLRAFNLVPEKDEYGVYQLASARNLCIFATLVNNGSTNINAVLTDDINLNGIEWTAIGHGPSYSKTAGIEGVTNPGFGGVFDGQGHTVSNFVIAEGDEADALGLFGIVTGTVKNVGVIGASFNATQDCRAGGLAGTVTASATSTGLVENCFVTNSSIIATERVCGGVVGAVCGGTVRNCYGYSNTLLGHDGRFGGIAGDTRNDAAWAGTVDNCYTDHQRVTSTSPKAGTTNNSEANVTAARFKSGEIAYLLNRGAIEGDDVAWYQTLPDDETPVLDDTHYIVRRLDNGVYANFDEVQANLLALVQEAQSLINMTMLDNMPLITSTEQFSTNCAWDNQGSINYLLDGSTNTYFHSIANTPGALTVQSGEEYLQVNFNKPVDAFYLEFTGRSDGQASGNAWHDTPNQVTFKVSNTPDDEASWIQVGTETYDLPNTHGVHYMAATPTKLGGMYSSVRMYILSVTSGNAYWNLSEIQMYSAEGNLYNTNEAVKAAVDALSPVADAKFELAKAGKGTQVDVNELEALIEALRNATSIQQVAIENNAYSKKSLATGIYTLDGRLVKANADGVKSLPKGLYIIDGKKTLVK